MPSVQNRLDDTSGDFHLAVDVYHLLHLTDTLEVAIAVVLAQDITVGLDGVRLIVREVGGVLTSLQDMQVALRVCVVGEGLVLAREVKAADVWRQFWAGLCTVLSGILNGRRRMVTQLLVSGHGLNDRGLVGLRSVRIYRY